MSKGNSDTITMELEFTDDSFYGMEGEENQDGQLFSRHTGLPVGTDEGEFLGSEVRGIVSISTRLRKSQSGFFEGAAASLLIFDFTFDSPEAKHRFTNGCIDIEFESLGSGSTPEVKRWCPVHVVGDESSTVYSVSNSSLLSIGGSSMASISVGSNRGVERQGTTRFEWTSNAKANLRNGKTKGIIWRLSENENNKRGIPHKVTVALIVKKRGNFIARIGCEGRISPTYNPKYWRRLNSKYAAIVIKPSKSLGEKIDGLDEMDKIPLENFVDLPQDV